MFMYKTPKRRKVLRAIVGLLGLFSIALSLCGSTATVAPGSIQLVQAAEAEVWAIGTLDDSTDPFGGTTGTFTVGADPDSAFPPRVSGGGTCQTILFNLPSVSGPYHVYVSAADTAQNTTSGMQAIINGVRLTPRGAGSWEFKKWGNGGKTQGVQTLRWALPDSVLVTEPGWNTL
ncbi:MAG: hypothetical protein AMJ93_10145, partial [Anaerolineae bacterium SM23_84]